MFRLRNANRRLPSLLPTAASGCLRAGKIGEDVLPEPVRPSFEFP